MNNKIYLKSSLKKITINDNEYILDKNNWYIKKIEIYPIETDFLNIIVNSKYFKLFKTNEKWPNNFFNFMNYFDKNFIEINWEKTFIESQCIKFASWDISLSQLYGLKKQKNYLYDIFYKQQFFKENRLILLFGPPGCGKTSLIKELASNLNLEFFLLNCGGLSDASLLYGNHKNYTNTEPGFISKCFQNWSNPLIFFDEIDKSSLAFQQALLPLSSGDFRDVYLNEIVPPNIYIFSANNINNICQPLLDRMEIIEFTPEINLEQFVWTLYEKKYNLSLEFKPIENKSIRDLHRKLDNYFFKNWINAINGS